MRVLLVEPKKAAREAEIGSNLRELQSIVGGLIQAIYPYEEPIALVCNDEGKLIGLPLNRALRDPNGDIYDIIAGTFFICGLDDDHFASLSHEHVDKFMKEFRDPEVFKRIDGKIFAIKVTDKKLDAPTRSREHYELDR